MSNFDLKKYLIENKLTINSQIDEIGEGNRTILPWSLEKKEIWEESQYEYYNYIYNFTTKLNTKYYVNIEGYFEKECIKNCDTYSSVLFGTQGDVEDKVINKGETFQVMTTIFDILKHFYNEFKHKYKINKVEIMASGDELKATQRMKMYVEYIKKNFPIKKMEYDGETLIIYLTKTSNTNTNINKFKIDSPSNNTPRLSKNQLYYPEMEMKKIPVYLFNPTEGYWVNNKDRLESMEVGVSPKYPNYYVLAMFSKIKLLLYNKEGEIINTKKIPIPMYNDPKWIDKFKHNLYPPMVMVGPVEKNIFDTYVLIPKNEVK